MILDLVVEAKEDGFKEPPCTGYYMWVAKRG